jgi:hypothetical protein
MDSPRSMPSGVVPALLASGYEGSLRNAVSQSGRDETAGGRRPLAAMIGRPGKGCHAAIVDATCRRTGISDESPGSSDRPAGIADKSDAGG